MQKREGGKKQPQILQVSQHLLEDMGGGGLQNVLPIFPPAKIRASLFQNYTFTETVVMNS
jgi:hypothetical protein